MLFLRKTLDVVLSVWLFVFYLFETVPMLYDDDDNNNNNSNTYIHIHTYSWMYVAVSILDCNYSPVEPTVRVSMAHPFDGKFMSAGIRMFYVPIRWPWRLIPQTPRGMVWDWTHAPVVRYWRLIARAMARAENNIKIDLKEMGREVERFNFHSI